jgi:predicted transcriptional regulator of viral defense system
MNYSSVSSNEAFMLSLVKKGGFTTFGVSDIAHLSGWDRSRIHNTLASLLRKGTVIRVRRGRYALTENITENILQISTDLVKPSYISFWTALSHYGFTEQQVRNVQLVSTKQLGKITIGDYGVEIITLKSSRFFGYVRTEGFVIAEPEKALIDSLFRPDLCGGLDEFAKCLEYAWIGLEESKLVQYAIGFDNKSLISRLGHLIETLELETREIDGLLSERSRSYVSLDPEAKRLGEYDRRWRVIVNHKIDRERIR